MYNMPDDTRNFMCNLYYASNENCREIYINIGGSMGNRDVIFALYCYSFEGSSVFTLAIVSHMIF